MEISEALSLRHVALATFRVCLRLIVPAILTACLIEGNIGAQQKQDNPQIELQVKTVSIVATVRDKHDSVVPNLTKDDFVVEEDGRVQTINYFAKEADTPLRLGLLVDTSLSQGTALDQERDASFVFMDHLLRPEKDMAFVIQFDREVELLRDFTPDRGKLQAALQRLESSEFHPTSRRLDSAWGRGATTLLYDAVFLAAEEMMSKQRGRKALILLSDGVDRGSKKTVDEAIETAQRADTVIYSVLFADEDRDDKGKRPGGPYGAPKRKDSSSIRADGKSILEEISEKTGGRLFQVSKKEPIEKIYSDIEEALRNQYSLGYTPDKGAGPGYHKLRVSTKRKDLRVQARQGYFGGQ
jgi:VWFA-related protein